MSHSQVRPRIVLCDCADAQGTTNALRYSRRQVLKAGVAGLAAAAASGIPAWGAPASVAEVGSSETLAATFFKGLSEEQRKILCFGFDDPLRSKVDNNWFIVKPRIDEILNKDQQHLVREIFLKLHSPEYAPRILAATEHDNGPRGLGACSVACFGEPGTGKFEFVLTGRHVTRRCDGDAVAGAAFGGPIFYGHAAMSDDEDKDHPGNVYWYQAKRANEVFQMLDGKQRDKALQEDHRREHGTATVDLAGAGKPLPGIRISELSVDQRQMVKRTLADLLAPFRAVDAAEVMKYVDGANSDALHMAFFKNDDIGNDGVWDIWQIEGPSMVWYFRGAPHVHTWVHVRKPA